MVVKLALVDLEFGCKAIEECNQSKTHRIPMEFGVV